MQAWKTNKTVQFAVGVTLVVLLIRWLITGDLLFAASTAMEPPPKDGETKSVALLNVLWPMFFEAMVIVGASAIAWSCQLWDALYGLVKPSIDGALQTSVAAPEAGSKSLSVDGLIQDLARAAATNDSGTLATLTLAIRKPYALAALTKAYMDNDIDRAGELTAELNSMLTQKPEANGAEQ
jgi:hypothetical protein